MLIILFICHLLLFCSIVRIKYSTDAPEPIYRQRFQTNLNKSRDPERYQYVESILQKATGIYSDTKYNQYDVPNLDKSILVTVVSASRDSTAHHLVFLRHLLCYVQHYHLKVVIYYAHHSLPTWKEEIEKIDTVFLVTYPDELFWELMNTKNNEISVGHNRATYDLDTPDFKSHGAMVMLVPVLEALQHGYNVLFLDADVTLVRDPVPFLTQGTADLSMSIESRGCQEYFSSTFPNFFDYHHTEPNSGVMYVRATIPGRTMFRKWIEVIIEGNVLNDQKAFRPGLFDAYHNPTCHQARDIYRTHPTEKIVPSSPSFCFYDELLVQNGMMGVQCPNRKQFRDEWIMAMQRHGAHIYSLNRTQENLRYDIDKSLVQIPPNARFPVILHSNYVNDKVHEYQIRGLWILRMYDDGTMPDKSLAPDLHNFCHRFHLSKTYYAQLNWTKEVSEIENRRRQLYNICVKPGALVKVLSNSSVFFLDKDLVKHEIPDGNTFDILFPDSWGKICTLPFLVMMNLTVGVPLESLKNSQHIPPDVPAGIPIHAVKENVPLLLAEVFKNRMKSSRDHTRKSYVDHVLRQAAGVYKQHSALHHRNRTVLVTVLSNEDPEYESLLDNMICTVEQWKMKLLVYVVPHKDSNIVQSWQKWTARGVYLLSYPDTLFWHSLANKNSIFPSSNVSIRVAYNTSSISFASYGQLVKLVPLLEILHHKYSALYLDLDVMLVQDPVKFITRSKADITMARNILQCSELYSTSSLIAPSSLSADSSIVFARADGISTLRRYIEAIVEANIHQDTDAFDPKGLHLHYDASCHKYPRLMTRNSTQRLLSSSLHRGSYCLLDEILFQNNYVGVRCSGMANYADDFIIEMVETSNGINSTSHSVYVPYTLHANYVKSKVGEIKSRDFWLVNEKSTTSTTQDMFDVFEGPDNHTSVCSHLDIMQTYYGRVKWTETYSAIKTKRNFLLVTAQQEGSLIQSTNAPTVFYVDGNRTRHAIPDGPTFEKKFGGDWNKIIYVPLKVLQAIPLGEPVQSVHAAKK